MADGYIAGWDSKKHYSLWRPVTAIHAARDGNTPPKPMPAWPPLLPTPPVQDYPSTHSVLGWAAAEVLIDLRRQGAFTSAPSCAAGRDAQLPRLLQAAEENADRASTPACTSATPSRAAAGPRAIGQPSLKPSLPALTQSNRTEGTRHMNSHYDRPGQARILCHARRRRPLGRLRRRDGQPRQQARAVQGDGRRRPAQREGAGRAHAAAPSATCASGSTRRRPAATSATTPSATPTSCRPNRRWCWPTRTARSTSRTPGTCRRRCGSTSRRRSTRSAPASGVAWGEHDARLYCGVAAFYRNGYRASLVPQWLPALDGVVAQLDAGIAVADVGCGHGHSTLLMAQAFPNRASTASTRMQRRSTRRGATRPRPVSRDG